jgi:predicted GNAT family N-acyltransferase|tara:strand:- start:186 stop:623 length:438 start_codon:yes stop_codon:yes gene_type:complete
MQTKSIIRVEQTSWQACESEIRRIRTAVFVEEQHVPLDLDFDGLDPECIHWLAYDTDNRPVGTGRLLPDGHFGRMAVLKSHRKRGIGDAIMRAVIKTAAAEKLPELYLHAQLTALPFYSGLGFMGYGEEFMDADMPHMAMKLVLI